MLGERVNYITVVLIGYLNFVYRDMTLDGMAKYMIKIQQHQQESSPRCDTMSCDVDNGSKGNIRTEIRYMDG